jgi:hypothetical protein
MFMSEFGHISETRQGKSLAKLAAIGERLAEVMAERAAEAETSQDAKIYVDCFHKLARGVRMTYALEMKLQRDEQAFLREYAPQMDKQRKEAVAARRNQLYVRLEHEVWDEFPDDETFHEFTGDIREHLEEEARLDTFLDETLEHQLARLKTKLGLGQACDDDDEPTSPDAAASAGGGPVAEERPVEGAGDHAALATADGATAAEPPDSS